MPSNWATMRAVIDALLPNGALWKAAPYRVVEGITEYLKDDGGLDSFLNGVANNHEVVRVFLLSLAFLRDPFNTKLLADLEREYGIVTNETLSDTDRRNALAAKKFALPGTGSVDDLQKKLDDAGFRLTVRQNDPMIDPGLFLANVYQCIANNTTAVAGNSAAFAGFSGGELLVNGDQYTQEINYLAQANGTNTVAGNDEAIAGFFNGITQTLLTYDIPDQTARWNYIFYVGGEVTDWTDPPIFTRGVVRSELEDLLKTIILQCKPMHSWCGLVVDYV